jgi:hypothetical protein
MLAKKKKGWGRDYTDGGLLSAVSCGPPPLTRLSSFSPNRSCRHPASSAKLIGQKTNKSSGIINL